MKAPIRHATFDPAAPVIIGVGEALDRPAADQPGKDTIALIADAVLAALSDAGGAISLANIDRISVVDALSRTDRTIPPHVALIERLGISPSCANSSPSPSGNFPVRFLNEAANAVATGQSRFALVCGGETMRSFARRSKATVSGTDIIRDYRSSGEDRLLQRYGILTPLDVYPFYEQATRHAWGQTHREASAESAAIWAGNAEVARDNPNAWIRTAPNAAEIGTPSAANPIVAYPYTRMMVANSGVNMAAALVLTRWEEARRLGIEDRHLAFIGACAGADEAPGNLERENFSEIPALRASLEQTLERNALTTTDLDLVELYSCFPCIPKIARRILGWPLTRPHSIYGGLTFGGGPLGNSMTHALVRLTKRIRSGSGVGLVLANGGFATKFHGIVLRPDPVPGGFKVLDPDVGKLTDALRGPIPPLIAAHNGFARLETYSVTYNKGVPRYATLVLRTAEETRCLARMEMSDDQFPILIDAKHDVVGAFGSVRASPYELNQWTFS